MDTYEKKYNELVEKLKKASMDNDWCDERFCCVISSLFPELKECDDKRMAKHIIDIVKCKGYDAAKDENFYAAEIAWLEKQGENKPTDKVEPKFKNGQWIVWQNKNYKVNDNGCGYELIDQDGLKTSLEYGTVDESAHLWDVTKDGQDGEVLVASDNSIFIFKEVCGTSCKHYIALTSDNEIEINTKLDTFWETTRGVKPAFKEQRDLLFQKMKEAGYEWKDKKLIKVPRPKESTGVLKQLLDEEKSWSKEDELIKLSIEQVINYASWSNIVPEEKIKINTWLKQLKYRIGG